MAERISEIYSLLVPLLDGRLIIPRSCVAEVVGFQNPSEMPGAPPWYLGMFAWGSRQIPLISFEGTCGQTIPPLTGRTRVVVLFALGSQIEGGYYGMVSQGFPQLVRVSAEVIRPDPGYVVPEDDPVVCRVRMLNETPWIPDLERLEVLIADETTVAPA
jgi:chemosensory pili system protein ChpC